jgi:3-oxoadipate enol-lactonase
VPAIGRLRYLEAAPRSTDSRRRGVLLLLHAFPVNARMWEPQFALAARGWRIVAPQMRGFDGGDQDPPGRSIDDYAGDTIDLLDALHVQEAVIGGLSMGGYVALAMFRHAPRYFQGLVLADTRSQADTPEGVEARKKMLQLVQDGGPPAVAEEMIPKLLGDTTRRTKPEVAETVRSLAQATRGDAIAGAIHAMMTRPDATPLLPSIHCPTLVLVGEEDTVTPPPLAEELHRGIPGSLLSTIPRAGHLSNLEQPDAFNATLEDFLERRV